MLTVELVYKDHKQAVENWKEGSPLSSWYDDNGNLCVKYQSGEWWHYELSHGEIVWW